MRMKMAAGSAMFLVAVYSFAALGGAPTRTTTTTVTSADSTVSSTSLMPSPAPIVYRGYACGSNEFGSLGAATGLLSPTVVPVDRIPEPKAVAAGFLHSLALDRDGRVWAWGDNTFGQCGEAADRPAIVNGLPRIVAIAAGWFHSVAVDADGGVWTWGNNSSGQLGIGRLGPMIGPKPVCCMRSAVAISAGMAHTLAMTEEGIVYAWGNNFTGQLGSEEHIDLLTFLAETGHLPSAPPSDPRDLWSWLASYLTEAAQSAQRLVAISPTFVRSGAVSIAAGALHSLAVLADGTVVAWGSDLLGECGDGRIVPAFSTAPVPSRTLTGPVTNARVAAAGLFFSAVLRNDGTVVTFGCNQEGQLGLGFTTPFSPLALRVGGLSGVSSISAGFGHTVVCLADGTARAWGMDDRGQLGDGTVIPFDPSPVTVQGIAGARSAAAGAVHTLFIAR